MDQQFHPDLRSIAYLLPRGAFNRFTVAPIRALTRLQARRTPKGVEAVTLPSGINVRLHHPSQPTGADAVLLWIHGGGYVIGSAAQDDGLCRRFADRLGVLVAAVDYRLAPKHPYPAALEDCYKAFAWLTRLPGVNPARIAIGGASAGGGLTAALALMARERGEFAPLFQLLVYPMLDDRSSDRPNISHRHFRMWNPETNRLGWSAYLRGAEPDVAVPARHADLRGLPPAWIGVGTLDPLHDENIEYARRLNEAGVACDIEVVPGAFHGFDIVARRAGVSRAFFGRQCQVLLNAYSH
ncbi:MAG: alpha/beta hydrolase [Mycobacteriaceae bacterium]|nr:alpha/beta hydrolase [Mycobacteriaceae bacterium]